MIKRVSQLRSCFSWTAIAAFVVCVNAYAQGSALGELTVDGNVAIERDGTTVGANSRDAVLPGDEIVISGADSTATVEFLEGGNMATLGETRVEIEPGQFVFGASGGGCFSNLGSPVDISVGGGSPLATGVTSGAVFDGVFYDTCEAAIAALEAAGGTLSLAVKTMLTILGVAVAVEVTDDDPAHGN